jgi:hypothetical protein
MDDMANFERLGHAMMLAWGRIKKMQSRTWGEWMTIGEGLLAGREWAMHQAGTNRPEGKGYNTAYGEWLKRFKVSDADGFHKSDRAKLLQLMEERPAVEEWRATLTDYDRRNLNNPTVAWRKWTAATRPKAKKRTAGTAASEEGRMRATAEQLQGRVEELEQELAAAREAMFEGEAALPQLFNFVVDVLAKLDAVANVPSQWPEKMPVKARTMITKEVRATLARFRGLRGRAEIYTEKSG